MNTARTALSSSLIALNDVSLYVVQAGAATQECIIFLHGFPESHASWAPYLRAFADTHLVVAPDNRGFGKSDKPTDLAAYDVQIIVADVKALIAYFSSVPVTLVGHDWGGIAAWHVAAQYPELLRRLVILNAPHPTIFYDMLLNDAPQRAAAAYIDRLRDTGCEARINAVGLETFWMSLFGEHLASGTITEEQKAEQLKTWSAPDALTAMLNWYRASPFSASLESQGASTKPERLAKITVPTLVIWGMQDALLLPCQLAGLSDYVSTLTVKTLVRAGHGVVHEAVSENIALIREFLIATDRN